jgi:hypothetical protein
MKILRDSFDKTIADRHCSPKRKNGGSKSITRDGTKWNLSQGRHGEPPEIVTRMRKLLGE